MKIITKIALTALFSTFALAETTMCFKENHTNMATIEKTKLNGGLCNGTKSAKEMKKEGWTIDDIKINDNNYTYIFKKETTTQQNVDIDALEAQILARLEVKRKDDIQRKKTEKRYNMSVSGKKMYLAKCQKCHGPKGGQATGNSRPINTLNLFDFKTTIRDYGLGEYDRGTAMSMIPYSNIMREKDVTNVYLYLKSINKTEKKESEKKTDKK